MIIVRVSGGLGNQLFQYAFARSVAEKTHLKVKLDSSHLCPSRQRMVTERKFLLDKFCINIGVTNWFDIVIKKIRTDIFKNMKIVHDIKLGENDNPFSHIKACSYFVGNWLNPKYFESVKDILIKEVVPKNKLSKQASEILKIIESTNSVSVHIRRGDYLKHTDKFVLLDIGYYKKAVEIMKSKVDNLRVFIFSDDIDYVRNNFRDAFGKDVAFVSGTDIADHEELVLMSKCKHNIIANSSFSWWGAWLNQNPDKIVIAPEKMRNDGKDMSAFIPPELGWIRI